MVSVVTIIILQLFQIFVMAWTANEITIQVLSVSGYFFLFFSIICRDLRLATQ